LLMAVVRPQISTPPSAFCAAATTLKIRKRFLCAELLDWQLTMTKLIALTLAIAIDKQLANSMCAD
jgi:hypothetical protein